MEARHLLAYISKLARRWSRFVILRLKIPGLVPEMQKDALRNRFYRGNSLIRNSPSRTLQ